MKFAKTGRCILLEAHEGAYLFSPLMLDIPGLRPAGFFDGRSAARMHSIGQQLPRTTRAILHVAVNCSVKPNS